MGNILGSVALKNGTMPSDGFLGRAAQQLGFGGAYNAVSNPTSTAANSLGLNPKLASFASLVTPSPIASNPMANLSSETGLAKSSALKGLIGDDMFKTMNNTDINSMVNKQ